VEDHAQGGNKITAYSLPRPDFSQLVPFKRDFWDGPPGEDTPSEELKDTRKKIGST